MPVFVSNAIFKIIFFLRKKNICKAPEMGSRKTHLIKVRLMAAINKNKKIPAWNTRTSKYDKTPYRPRRHWKTGKLKIY